MEVGRCIEIVDLYEWLPGYGENGVELRTYKSDLSVIISYDSPLGELEKELFFQHAAAFSRAAAPGPGLLDLQFSEHGKVAIGSLLECPDSEAAHAWTQHFAGRVKIRHYNVTFLAENISLVVFAENVILREDAV